MSTYQQMRSMVVSNYLQLRAPVMLLDLDEQGIVRDANQCARRLLGDTCVGTAITLLLIDFKNRFDLGNLRVIRPNTLLSFRGASGAPISLQVSFLPIGSGGLLVGEHDHQETEELQNTLLKLNSELSVISRELQKKTAQLEHANDLKNQFLGIAAHDLRSPLAGIYAYIELLMEDLRPLKGTGLAQSLEEIHREVSYMLNLVTNLLDYSVIEQGHLDLARQEIEVRQLLQQVVQMNGLLAQKRQVRVTLQIRHDPGSVNLDLNRLRQVLNNLLGNAIKYTPEEHEVTLTLDLLGQDLLFQVRDQGKGVPEGELGRLFTPFGKTSARSLSGDKSTGLGLSICKKIVEAHGGRIWHHNLPEGGACFSFTLPIGEPHDQTAAA
ncbi:MAG: HAMP domain-containing histidine kinase [Geobacter sp.]|nr:HAMP domain-containing histidine kinase [Geobacter sp.]